MRKFLTAGLVAALLASGAASARAETVQVPSPLEPGEEHPEKRAGDLLVAGDRLVVAVPREDALEILTTKAGRDGWRLLARLYVAGMDAARWTGVSCVTGSGRHVAATFAPVEFANRSDLRDRGAFAAVVDLQTGDEWVLPERVALKYHTPGCGDGDKIAFLRHLGADQSETEVLVVDAAQRRIEASIRVDGHLASAVPMANGVAAAAGRGVVEVAGDGASRTLARMPGGAFGLLANDVGGVDFLADEGTSVSAWRLGPEGNPYRLADGGITELGLVPGRHGRNRLLGTPRNIYAPIDVIAAPVSAEAVSLDGSVAVERIAYVADADRPGTESVEFSVLETGSGVRVTDRVDDAVDDRKAVQALLGLTPPASTSESASTAANVTIPKCAVPRSDAEVQVMQPLPSQVEWAVHRAVRGELDVLRPPNWNRNGISSGYRPQTMFPPVPLSGGGRIPAQVVLGILAQESNFWQASKHALPGVPSNPLIADYYGTTYDSAGRIIGMDYAKADCGYGIAQVTDNMTAVSTYYTPDQKRAIATDYAANIAAGLQILARKWNEAWSQGLLANDGDPSKIENWYFAIWGYNSGIYAPSGTAPYGVGWTNNPANMDWDPQRQPFLRTSYGDAATPWKWPYQERVLGWAETPLLDYRGNPSYFDLPTSLILPTDRFLFCVPEVNQCDPTAYNEANPNISYCTRADRKCWWHGQRDLFQPPGGTPENVSAYQAGAPEPLTSNPHPPACTTLQSGVPTSPDLPTLPLNAVVVDELPHTQANIVGCVGQANPGTFELTFGRDSTGAELSRIDFHQIGAGYGGHFWFAHTLAASRPALKVTGTWRPPASVLGWQRIFVHVPDHGADTYQADYQITTGVKTYHRVVNQRWNSNVWVDLGRFNLLPGSSVSLSNVTYGDHQVDRPIDIAWDAVAFVPASKPTVSLVAFGDSYSAGEGVEPYYANSDVGAKTPGYKNACHRSSQAYPQLVYDRLRITRPGGSEFHFAACSGAEIPDLLGPDQHFGEVPQLEQGWLDENTTHVTVSIGGNDAGFGDIITGCILTITACTSPDYRLQRDGVTDPEPLIEYEPQVISELRPRMVSVLARIKERAPNAVVTFVGYPHVVWEEGPGSGNGCWALDVPTVTWFAEMADLMTSEMAAAAQAGVRFADVRAAFEDHEACTTVADEWINAVINWSETGSGRSVPGSGSFHPKASGQSAYRSPVFVAMQ